MRHNVQYRIAGQIGAVAKRLFQQRPKETSVSIVWIHPDFGQQIATINKKSSKNRGLMKCLVL